MLALSSSCSCAKRSQLFAISTKAARASSVEATDAAIRHPCERRRYSSALVRDTASPPLVRQTTNEMGQESVPGCGSWLCENSSDRRARRNISKKLRTMESNHAAPMMFDTLSENCLFYISPMY